MFFPLCWLFNYTWVGKACIYGALTECEPVQLKCLQANAQSHKAVPLGLFHSSTRLLMTAMCLPWREGPSARHWHRPGNSNWGRVVCVKFPTNTAFQRKSGDVWERKYQADSRCHLCKSPGPMTSEPTCWREICSPGHSDQLPKLAMRAVSGNLGMLVVVRGKAARPKCKGKSMEGQRRVSLTSRPQRSNMSHLSWPLVQVF